MSARREGAPPAAAAQTNSAPVVCQFGLLLAQMGEDLRSWNSPEPLWHGTALKRFVRKRVLRGEPEAVVAKAGCNSTWRHGNSACCFECVLRSLLHVTEDVVFLRQHVCRIQGVFLVAQQRGSRKGLLTGRSPAGASQRASQQGANTKEAYKVAIVNKFVHDVRRAQFLTLS
ncbi:hypothetical protein NDU88_001033 [Pleurodeles waltl]|uniref:Uncharacterized protein n=1 Tax=Pleurodeles waltl TaxID=8319 RepID=A0AAV7SZ53_PLEWA|nr:hypothetical protein NDU88_001033 [Pleurodeles waltl]